MSLNWSWNNKVGECVYDNGHTCNLYEGNALIIAIEETDTTYSLGWFAADLAHMKNMLGLTKGHDNCFEDFGVAKLRFNEKARNAEKLVSLFAKAKMPITVEFYKEVSE